MISTVTTMRLPNSMTGWKESGGVRRRWAQVGQSGQPSPESDSRTAAPVATFRMIVAREIRHRRTKARGLGVKVGTASIVPSHLVGSQTAARAAGRRTGRARGLGVV